MWVSFATLAVAGALVFLAGVIAGVFGLLCYLDAPMKGRPLRGKGK